MTWPGDSLGIDWGVSIAGSSFTTFDMSVKGDGRSTALVAGDKIGLAFETWQNTMDTGDVATAQVKWVITVAGTSGLGTLRLADALDPDYDDPFGVDDLGDHPVVAGQTLMVPASAVTATAIYADDQQADLTIECVSGSVSIDQVKIGLWPDGAPRGNWGETVYPSYDGGVSTAVANRIYSKFDQADATGVAPASSYAAQAAVRVEFAADDQPTYPKSQEFLSSPITDSVSGFLSGGEPPFYEDYFSDARGLLRTAFAVGGVAARRDPSGGTGFVANNPNATRNDENYRKLDVGDPWVEWVNDSAYLQRGGPDTLDGSVIVGATPLPVALTFGFGTITSGPSITWPSSGVTLASDGDNLPLSLTESGYIITLQHSMLFADLEPSGYDSLEDQLDVKFGVWSGSSLDPMGYVEHYPAYKRWDPDAAPPVVDDDEEPLDLFGQLLTPNSNIAGLGDGVDVNFA